MSDPARPLDWKVADASTGGLCGIVVYRGEEVLPGLFSNETEWFYVSTKRAQQVCDALNENAALLAHRAQLVELAEKWRRQFPVSALKACDDYYTGEAHGTLKCLKQVEAVLASGEGGEPTESGA